MITYTVARYISIHFLLLVPFSDVKCDLDLSLFLSGISQQICVRASYTRIKAISIKYFLLYFPASWVHCNDAKVEMCTIDDVTRSQVYILFYTKMTSPDDVTITVQNSPFEEPADEEITFNFKNSSIPRFEELKRRLSGDNEERPPLKRHKSTLWWQVYLYCGPPVLLPLCQAFSPC